MRKWTTQVFLLELRKLITYRADFWVNFFGQTIFSLTIAYFLWSSIFHYSGKDTMNGHTMTSMMFYYLIAPLIFRIQQGQGIGFVAREIYEGELNKYIVYPIDYFKFKLSTYLANSFFFLAQLVLIISLYNVFFYNSDIFQFSLFRTTLFILVITICCITYFYLSLLCELLAFWFDNTWSLAVILRFAVSFLGGALIPLVFFPTWATEVLELTPFPYLIDFPIQTLIGREFNYITFGKRLLIAISWTVLFRFLAMKLWRRGNYQYTGVGI